MADSKKFNFRKTHIQCGCFLNKYRENTAYLIPQHCKLVAKNTGNMKSACAASIKYGVAVNFNAFVNNCMYTLICIQVNYTGLLFTNSWSLTCLFE